MSERTVTSESRQRVYQGTGRYRLPPGWPMLTTPSGRRVTGVPSGTALVGRDDELARLVGWVDDLTSGSGHAVLIEGEPGIGKSSLARATEIGRASCRERVWSEG